MANLYQHSAAMLDRLSAVPGFEDAFLAGSDSSVDPVTRLWDCLRNGASLCYLINYLHPNAIETVHSPQQAQFTSNLAKANIYHFLIACKTVLKMDDTSLFTIRELTMNDTNGFIRVLRTLETVMQLLDDDILVKRAREQRLSSFRSSKSVDFRLSMESATNNAEKVIAELLETERKYVADLELLQDYKRTVVESQVVSEHISRQIFGNIDQLVDFQRKFLIGVEDACRSTNRAERIAQLFESNENYFSVYAPYCANHRAAAEAALGAAPELAKLKNGIEPNYDLPSFLIKPIQRICKYPLLLRELNRFIPEVLIHLKKSLTNAGESINRVASMINELRRLEENAILVQTLEKQVEDWKVQTFKNYLRFLNNNRASISKISEIYCWTLT
jgi:cell division control protein 24